MSDHIYKTIEVVGTSSTSIEEAVNNALTRCGETLHNLRWFVVTETRGAIDGGRVAQWQVTLKVSFTLEEKG
jgi:flavin-binding protein dodecin